MSIFDESEEKRAKGGMQFRQTPKVGQGVVDTAAHVRKDKRKKKGRTIRFETHDADEVFRLVKEWASFLAAEKGREIGAELEPFPDNDIFVWCIKRGLQALDDGERPRSVVSGSLIS